RRRLNASSEVPPSSVLGSVRHRFCPGGISMRSPPSCLSVLGRVCALGLIIQSIGCSFAYVENAPPQAEWPREATSLETRSPCTESTTPAFTDGAIAAGLAGLSVMVWLDSRNPWPNSEGDVPVG